MAVVVGGGGVAVVVWNELNDNVWNDERVKVNQGRGCNEEEMVSERERESYEYNIREYTDEETEEDRRQEREKLWIVRTFMNIPERFRADQQASDYPEFLYSLARQAKQHLPYLSIIIIIISDTFSVWLTFFRH